MWSQIELTIKWFCLSLYLLFWHTRKVNFQFAKNLGLLLIVWFGGMVPAPGTYLPSLLSKTKRSNSVPDRDQIRIRWICSKQNSWIRMQIRFPMRILTILSKIQRNLRKRVGAGTYLIIYFSNGHKNSDRIRILIWIRPYPWLTDLSDPDP